MLKFAVAFAVGFGLCAVALFVLNALGADRHWVRGRIGFRAGLPLVGILIGVAQVGGEFLSRLIDRSVDGLDLSGVTELSREVVVLAVVGAAAVGLFEDVISPRVPSLVRAPGHPLVTLRRAALLIVAAFVASAHAWDGGFFDAEVTGRAVLIFLSATLFSEFDTGRGRCAKLGIIASAAMMVVSVRDPNLAGLAMVMGSAIVLLVPEMRRRSALGLGGSLAMGASFGAALSMWLDPDQHMLVVWVMLALVLVIRYALSERSWGREPLRTLDRLGTGEAAR